MTPFPTLPAGNCQWLVPVADCFATVYGTSDWQGLAHHAGSPPAGSLPCFYDSREKFVHFGSAQPGRARLVRARACHGQKSDFEKFCVKMSGIISSLPAVLRHRNSDFLKNRRNVFRIGTYLRPKMNGSENM